LTRPKDLDSKFGEYLRTLMLRKINDPEYRIPYILRTKPRPIIKKYRRFVQLQKDAKYFIPK
jgi:large subunit ribosomal protein L28